MDSCVTIQEKARKLFNFYRDQNTILTLNINRCYAMIQSDVELLGININFRYLRKKKLRSKFFMFVLINPHEKVTHGFGTYCI